MFVRLLVGDDPQETPIAERAFHAAVASGGFDRSDVVLAEVAWVLRGYNLDRLPRHNLQKPLIRPRGVVMHLIGAVINTLEIKRQGGDLENQLILARASRVEG